VRTYLNLTGTAGSFASTPDSLGLSPSLELDAWVDTDAWYPAAAATLIGAYETSGNQRAWRLRLNPNNSVTLLISSSGANLISAGGGAVAFLGGSRGRLRATWRASDGRVQFFTAPSGSLAWAQFGANATLLAAQIYDSSAPLEIGSYGLSEAERLAGHVFAAGLCSSIDGPIVASPDFTQGPVGATSIVDGQGNVWSINGGAAIVEDLT
jgi:hypothetical protein